MSDHSRDEDHTFAPSGFTGRGASICMDGMPQVPTSEWECSPRASVRYSTIWVGGGIAQRVRGRVTWDHHCDVGIGEEVWF